MPLLKLSVTGSITTNVFYFNEDFEMSDLKTLAKQIADLQKQLDGEGETTRERVLRMGKTLRLMQTKQKIEQVEAKQRGETPVTWKEWLEEAKVAHEATFPEVSVWQTANATHSSADTQGRTSNHELLRKPIGTPDNGRKMAESHQSKKRKRSTNPLVLVRHKASPFERKVKVINDMIADSDVVRVADELQWDEDIIEGCRESRSNNHQRSKDSFEPFKSTGV